ncbi:MAG: NAD(P)-binding oxidoreductase [Deinococcota bacterium]
MTTLVVGATGATGKLLVSQLLERGEQVKVIVRSPDNLPASVRNHPNLTVTQASILDLTEADIADHIHECQAIASCLGHNLSFKGIFGEPRRLVRRAIQNLCNGILKHASTTPVKFVLMNTTGNRNRDLDEPVSLGQQLVVSLMRLLLPPHADNEEAADYLRTQIDRQAGFIEWVVVRPDNLINEDNVSAYGAHTSPTRSAIFNPGKTSRSNVAHFMAELILNDDLWQQWRWQMPVLYNQSSS